MSDEKNKLSNEPLVQEGVQKAENGPNAVDLADECLTKLTETKKPADQQPGVEEDEEVELQLDKTNYEELEAPLESQEKKESKESAEKPANPEEKPKKPVIKPKSGSKEGDIQYPLLDVVSKEKSKITSRELVGGLLAPSVKKSSAEAAVKPRKTSAESAAKPSKMSIFSTIKPPKAVDESILKPSKASPDAKASAGVKKQSKKRDKGKRSATVRSRKKPQKSQENAEEHEAPKKARNRRLLSTESTECPPTTKKPVQEPPNAAKKPKKEPEWLSKNLAPKRRANSK